MQFRSLNNLKIRTKLFIFLIVPILTILYFSISGINLKYQEQISTEKSLDFIEVSLVISDLIFELQKERGLSAGFVGSKGTKFKQDLQQQRLNTDNKKEQFIHKVIQKNTLEQYPELNKLFIDFQKSLEQLSDIRTRMDTLKEGDFFESYSYSNAGGLEIIANLHAFIFDNYLSKHIDTYTTLLLLQEKSGQERGLLNGIFLTDKLDATQFKNLSAYSNTQESLIAHFFAIAPAHQKGLLQERMKQPVFQEVSEFKAAVINKATKNDLLNSLQLLIGYGGLIHDFKNYVIRNDKKNKERFDKLFKNTIKTIEKYRNLQSISIKEIDSLNTIEKTFLRYHHLLKTSNKLKKSGKTIQEIDKIVKVDDTPALAAIEYLHKTVTGLNTSTWWEKASQRISLIKEVSDHIKTDMLAHAKEIKFTTKRSLYIYFTLTITSLLLSGFLGYLLIHRLVGGIIHISNHMTLMQEHDDIQDIKDEGKDEISQVAKAFNNLIRERKKSETQLHLASAVFKNTKEAISVTDADNKIIMVNPAFSKITGYKAEEAIGNTPAMLQSGKHSKSFYKNMWQSLLQNDHWVGEIENKRKNGDIYIEMLNISIIRNNQGKIIMHIGMFLDITQRKKLEEKQEQLKKQLMQAQKMESLGQLTGGIAHDFNNILAAILGYTDLANDRNTKNTHDELLHNYLNEVRDAGIRAKHVVEQLLSFSRSGNSIDLQRIDVAPMINASIKMIRPLLPSTIELTNNIIPNNISLVANPTMLHQVIMNICINARDAIEEYGKINFEVREAFIDNEVCSACHKPILGNYIEISISDTGDGIDEKDIEHLFTPFFTTKKMGSQKGIGMGLSMVHGIMHDLNGHIVIESIKNQGSKFRLLFPDIPEEVEIEKKPNTITLESKSTNRQIQHNPADINILCVDDEESIVGFMKEMLEMHGYNVDIFTDSNEALIHFKENADQFDLIITDQTMPKLTGSEMSQEMLRIKPDTSIILCSGYSDTIDETSAKAMGIKAYMTKPLNMKLLLETIGHLCTVDNNLS